jgi:O-antigen ligase
MIFQFVRQKNVYGRVLYAGILVLVLFIMFATITRGPIVSLSIALAYLAILMRRHMRVVPMTLIATGGLALVFGMNFFVANFTRSGNLFDRVAGTQMVGWMPETRVGTWTEAWQRMMYHPIIGWGPYYSSERGLEMWYWPHNLYLYVGNLTGLVGLTCFLWLLWSFWRMTRPRADTLTAPSYLDGYMLIAHVQMTFFVIDQFKIEYLRNNNYQYQVWLMFAMWASAYRVRQDQLRDTRPQG